MLGREVRLPAEIMFGSGTTHVGEQVSSYGDYVEKLRNHMNKAHEVTRERLQKCAVREKQGYDAKKSVNQYKVGDLVWYQTEIGQQHVTPKLRRPFQGPFLVIKKLNDLNYMLQLNEKGTRKVVHHNKLKPYKGQMALHWARSALKQAQRRAT